MSTLARLIVLVLLLAGLAPAMPSTSVSAASLEAKSAQLAALKWDFRQEVISYCKSGPTRCNPKFFHWDGVAVYYSAPNGLSAKFRVPPGIKLYGGGNFTGPFECRGNRLCKTPRLYYAEFVDQREQLPG